MKRFICEPSLLALFEGKGLKGPALREALEQGAGRTPSAKVYHVDVMDGKFVPQVTEFFTDETLVSDFAEMMDAELSVHLMVDDPLSCVKRYALAGASYITFHIESSSDPKEVISAIREQRGVKAGIAINPATPLSSIIEFLPDLDMVLLMSVVPGMCGQAYHEEVTAKIKELSGLITQGELETIIEVDGGIKITNAYAPLSAGANAPYGLMLVMGSGVYGHKDPDGVIKAIEDPILAGSDHGGLVLKGKLLKALWELSVPYADIGTYTTDSCDHPVIAGKVAKAVSEGEVSRGILVCGTGIGMSIGANRFKGVRGALMYQSEVPGFSVALATRTHNDSNIAIFGERSMDHERAVLDLKTWLSLPGAVGKYQARNELFDRY